MSGVPNFRRQILQDVVIQADTHAGLWLDRYLVNDRKPEKKGEESGKERLVREVTTVGTSEAYIKFFDRWRAVLTGICGERNCRQAEVQGRMAVNLGAEAVLETSTALHHTYGVPYIPGSALKGLAAHYVLSYEQDSEWGDRKSKAFRTMFGDTSDAGYVTFFDALYVPDSGKKKRALWKDVITVHHPDYYQGAKPEYLHGQESPPGDWDSPVPIPFITATGKFLIALAGPEEWVDKAFEILALALEREGIGAKTNSGYGRMTFKSRETETGGAAAAVQRRAPREIPAGYERGVVKMFNERQGFGFIQPDRGGHDVFVHVTDLEQGVNSLQLKQKVVFKRGPGKKAGQEQAFDVRLDV